MIRDKSTFHSKKHDKIHAMLNYGVDGILSAGNITEDKMLQQVTRFVNLMKKARKEINVFKINSIGKLIKTENYKSYNYLKSEGLLEVERFPLNNSMVKDSVFYIDFDYSFTLPDARFGNNKSVYDYFFKSNKEAISELPEALYFYLMNPENEQLLYEFIEKHFHISLFVHEEKQKLMSMFNNEKYENISNEDIVCSYLLNTFKEIKYANARKSLQFYPTVTLAYDQGNKSLSYEISQELQVNMNNPFFNAEKRIDNIENYREDMKFEMITVIKGFEMFFELLPGLKQNGTKYQQGYSHCCVLNEKAIIESILSADKGEKLRKVRL